MAILICFDCKVCPASPHFYWANSGQEILRSRLDDSSISTSVSNGMGNIGGFVVDRRTNQIYWNTGFHIYRSNLDGSNTQSIFQFPSESFRGDITIDPLRDHLYFIDGRNNIIFRSNIDGSDPGVVVPARGIPSNISGMSDLWLDPWDEKLYWNYNDALHRTNLDGSGEEVLLVLSAGVEDFEIDPSQGKVYWAASSGVTMGNGSVRRANLDGTGRQVIASQLWWANGVALDLPRGKLYFTDSWLAGPSNYDATIRRANLDGTSTEVIYNLGPGVLDRPMEMTLDTLIIPEPTSVSLIMLALILCGGVKRHH